MLFINCLWICSKIANEKEALELLRKELPSDLWEISVLMHSSKRSPCELAHIFNDVDVLLTPHGFQSMLLLFLPRPAIVFEVFPYRYWKRGYGPLSKEYGNALVISIILWDLIHTLLIYFLFDFYCRRCNSRRSDVPGY